MNTHFLCLSSLILSHTHTHTHTNTPLSPFRESRQLEALWRRSTAEWFWGIAYSYFQTQFPKLFQVPGIRRGHEE